MKNLGTKTYVALGSGIVFVGAIIFLGILSLLVPRLEDTDIDFNADSFNSRYIISAVSNVEDNTEEFEVEGGRIEESKQGILEVEESRKVIKIDKTLTDSQKLALESKYDVKFTSDTNTKGVYVLTLSESSDITSLETELKSKLETDVPVKIAADVVDWGITRIGADKVWSSGSGGGVTIAIIDTGVQKDHPDLVNNLITGYDYVNNDSDATDDNGHGTHVAGIAAATLNQAGSVGASHTAKILPLKALNSEGYGYLSDVAKAIYYATDNGARVINMSIGSSSDSLVLKDAVNYAASKGVLLVAAAGNNGGAPCSYPAAYGNVICVMATDSKNLLASFSNIGGELSAPGVYNYSTYLGGTYRYLSGTSMASPHVAGASALLMSVCPTCTTNEIRTLMRETAIDLGDPGLDILFGYGLVDLTSAVARLSDNIVEPEPETPIEEPIQEPVKDPKTKPVKPTNPKKVSQKIVLEEPQITRGQKYIPTTVADIDVKYTLSPIVSDSDLDKVVLYVDNVEIGFSNSQNGEFIASKDLFNHSQHWIKTVAFFKDGSQSSSQIIIDMTYLRSMESTSNRGTEKSVLGISTSIFSLFKIFNPF